MLKISIVDEPGELRFVLQGKLIEPWVSELRAIWKDRSTNLGNRIRVVDLKDATVIDQSGLKTLAMMHGEGARFVAQGVLTRYFLKCLAKKRGFEFRIENEN
jgi:hypothetical protein